MAPLPIACVAFISRNNTPIYIANVSQGHHDLKYHYIAHTSVDIIEERVAAGLKVQDVFLGLLYSLEDLAVYGYLTPTKLKILLIVPLLSAASSHTPSPSFAPQSHSFSSNTSISGIAPYHPRDYSSTYSVTALPKDVQLKEMFRRLHLAYMTLISNPFYDMDTEKKMSSQRFARRVEEIVKGEDGGKSGGGSGGPQVGGGHHRKEFSMATTAGVIATTTAVTTVGE